MPTKNTIFSGFYSFLSFQKDLRDIPESRYQKYKNITPNVRKKKDIIKIILWLKQNYGKFSMAFLTGEKLRRMRQRSHSHICPLLIV